MTDTHVPEEETRPEQPGRRSFLSSASTFLMFGGLAAGYGACAGVAGRFLYPAKPREKAWQFVVQIKKMKVGEALTYQIPGGEGVTVARQGSGETEADFIALSSTCPHLGCQVKWEARNNRFFCPCHNGVFDPSGKGVSGPPGDAEQSLPAYPLKAVNGLLFIEVPMDNFQVDAGSTLKSQTRRT
ncbi:MAG: ubiquinol-cytochrome c reductase iron-sulfur subunit [Planctomycetota bacterium]|nr:MAG: ubiquinol-cytochrome c reductase iron-sulfur subunit [Planctomycetota bacterium]